MNKATPKSILVAGIGNIFLGDDGFGCEAARQLASMRLTDEVTVVDFGIRGLDLAYALLEPYKAVILVDAIARGGEPGTVYILQPANVDRSSDAQMSLDPHSMDPVHLMAMARSLGEITAEMFIVGCEPADFGDELEGRMSLSDAVKAAVPEAVRAVVELVNRIRQHHKHEETISLCGVQ